MQMKEINREIEKQPEVDAHNMTEQEQIVAFRQLRELEQRQHQIMKELGIIFDLNSDSEEK